MSTKSFYTFYITKTPSQPGFGCRKSVEKPVENRVENRPARHIRSQFDNAGSGVLTHQPSVCSRCGPRSLRHVTLGQGLSVSPAHPGPGPQRLSRASWALPWKARRAWPRPGPRSCPARPRGPHLRRVTSTLAGTMPRGRGRSGWLVAPAGAAPPAGVAT